MADPFAHAPACAVRGMLAAGCAAAECPVCRGARRAPAPPGAPPPAAAGLLAGVVVVDVTRALSGPYCTRILRDLGARVIKVEPKGPLPNTNENKGKKGVSGDPFRSQIPLLRDGGDHSTRSGYFAFINSGKESVCLDYREEGTPDRALFDALLGGADVIVENFRPGVMRRMGYSAEELRRRHPRLIVASISGFGQAGPYAPRPAYDTVIQAMSGLVSVTGSRKDEPVRVGASVSDMVAGMYAAIGITSALARRERGGGGCAVDVSMLDASVALMGVQLATLHATGEAPGPAGNAHPLAAPFDVFECADGRRLCAHGSTTEWWRRLCGVLGRPGLAADPRFATNVGRLRNYAALRRELDAAFRARPRDAWLPPLTAAGLPSGPVNSIADVAADPQLGLRNMIVRTADGRHLLPGNPIKVAGVADPATRPPPPVCDADAARLRGEFRPAPPPAKL